MKKLLVFATLLAAALAVTAYITCEASNLWGKRIKGSDRIVTRTLAAPDFDAVSAARGTRVVLSDKSDVIRIDANDNLIDHVVVEEKEGILRITIDPKIVNVSNADITVTVPARNGAIRSLEASSAACILSDTELHADRANIDASSAAKIKVAYQANECVTKASSAARIDAVLRTTSCSFDASSAAEIEAEISSVDCSANASSAAKIEFEGSTHNLTAETSSAARIDAGELTADNAVVRASSGSGIQVGCRQSLKAHASSGASIRYSGECEIDAETSSGGSIRRK